MPVRKKKLTNAEKRERARFKKEMQQKGVIPPDKPRLNRKKFVEEAKNEWNEREHCYVWEIYLMDAISIMISHKDKKMRMSQEAVGAAKILKLAIRLKQFSDKLKSENRNIYKTKEQYEFIKDILDA